MKTNNYAEKIRRRKLRLKQNNPDRPWTKKERRAWLQVLTLALILLFVSGFLMFIYKDSLAALGTANRDFILPLIPLGIFIFLILWLLPKYSVRSLWRLQNEKLSAGQSRFDREKDKLALVDSSRKTFAEIIGGIFVILGLVLAYNNYLLTKDQADSARQEKVKESFSKMVTQLASEDVGIRVQGLRALEQAAKNSPNDSGKVLEIVSAHIHQKSPKVESDNGAGSSNHTASGEQTKKIDSDIQTALTIIGRRVKSDQDSSEKRSI